VQRSGLGNRLLPAGMILAGIVAVAAVLGFDLLRSRYGLLGEHVPDVSPGYLLRSAVLFLSLVLIALGVTSGSARGSQHYFWLGSRTEKLLIAAGLSISTFFAILFLVDPARFSDWSLEDGPVEWGSVLLLLGGSGVLLAALAKTGLRNGSSPLAKVALALLALVLFVIAMEEVSWFQRQLGLSAPDLFGHNEQGEMNFHNFATNRVENVYYFGAFIFLLVLPVLRLLFAEVFVDMRTGLVFPKPFVAIIGALACAYNFDMWNVAFTQVAFFGACIALFLFARRSRDQGTRIVVCCALILVLISQGVFLFNGENYSRLWEVTEYKEFMVPLGFVAYAIGVYQSATDLEVS